MREGDRDGESEEACTPGDPAAAVLLPAARGANLWTQDPDLPTAQPLARSPRIRGSGVPRQAPPLETPTISAEAGGSNRVPGALRNAGGRVGQGEGRGRAGRRGRGAGTDWPARRSEAVYGGWAGPPLQNKGQAARGAAAGRCLAPG